MSFHAGLDFTTGRAGAEINTVASGVVTWSGPRSGYGLMVEVNHGSGYTTRYAHAEKLLVDVGDIVEKVRTLLWLVRQVVRPARTYISKSIKTAVSSTPPPTFIVRSDKFLMRLLLLALWVHCHRVRCRA